jgi:hypothetical protein
VRHFVLTRSAYGPAWGIDANKRRLAVTRAVTANLMAQQTTRDWTWVVLLDERDPLLRERIALYRSAAPRFIPILRNSGPDDPSQRAAADYKAPWRAQVGPADDKILMTRIDDDDGFAPSALRRVQAAAAKDHRRVVLMFPMGIRVWAGRYTVVRHDKNAMHTLVTPKGDELCVYDYGHTTVRKMVRTVTVDNAPAWLWVRHRDTISDWRKAQRPIDSGIHRLFPIDWKALEAAWRS